MPVGAFERLPPEILELVDQHLTPLDYARLRECSKAFRDAVDRVLGHWRTAPSLCQRVRWWVATRRAHEHEWRRLEPTRLLGTLDPSGQKISACVLAAMTRWPKLVELHGMDADQLRNEFSAYSDRHHQRNFSYSDHFECWGWLTHHVDWSYDWSYPLQPGGGWRLLSSLTWKVVESTIAYAKWLGDHAAEFRRIIVICNADDICDCYGAGHDLAGVFPNVTSVAFDCRITQQSSDYCIVVPNQVRRAEFWCSVSAGGFLRGGQFSLLFRPGEATDMISIDANFRGLSLGETLVQAADVDAGVPKDFKELEFQIKISASANAADAGSPRTRFRHLFRAEGQHLHRAEGRRLLRTEGQASYLIQDM